ncbi:unnamed protein product [Amoebophrya sp. A120]|nr:unnamed protein product [Amoebophrya sp. A120]|eukprot:GSA120T00000096001.1
MPSLTTKTSPGKEQASGSSLLNPPARFAAGSTQRPTPSVSGKVDPNSAASSLVGLPAARIGIEPPRRTAHLISPVDHSVVGGNKNSSSSSSSKGNNVQPSTSTTTSASRSAAVANDPSAGGRQQNQFLAAANNSFISGKNIKPSASSTTAGSAVVAQQTGGSSKRTTRGDTLYESPRSQYSTTRMDENARGLYDEDDRNTTNDNYVRGTMYESPEKELQELQQENSTYSDRNGNVGGPVVAPPATTTSGAGTSSSSFQDKAELFQKAQHYRPPISMNNANILEQAAVGRKSVADLSHRQHFRHADDSRSMLSSSHSSAQDGSEGGANAKEKLVRKPDGTLQRCGSPSNATRRSMHNLHRNFENHPRTTHIYGHNYRGADAAEAIQAGRKTAVAGQADAKYESPKYKFQGPSPDKIDGLALLKQKKLEQDMNEDGGSESMMQSRKSQKPTPSRSLSRAARVRRKRRRTAVREATKRRTDARRKRNLEDSTSSSEDHEDEEHQDHDSELDDIDGQHEQHGNKSRNYRPRNDLHDISFSPDQDRQQQFQFQQDHHDAPREEELGFLDDRTREPRGGGSVALKEGRHLHQQNNGHDTRREELHYDEFHHDRDVYLENYNDGSACSEVINYNNRQKEQQPKLFTPVELEPGPNFYGSSSRKLAQHEELQARSPPLLVPGVGGRSSSSRRGGAGQNYRADSLVVQNDEDATFTVENNEEKEQDAQSYMSQRDKIANFYPPARSSSRASSTAYRNETLQPGQLEDKVPQPRGSLKRGSPVVDQPAPQYGMLDDRKMHYANDRSIGAEQRTGRPGSQQFRNGSLRQENNDRLLYSNHRGSTHAAELQPARGRTPPPGQGASLVDQREFSSSVSGSALPSHLYPPTSSLLLQNRQVNIAENFRNSLAARGSGGSLTGISGLNVVSNLLKAKKFESSSGSGAAGAATGGSFNNGGGGPAGGSSHFVVNQNRNAAMMSQRSMTAHPRATGPLGAVEGGGGKNFNPIVNQIQMKRQMNPEQMKNIRREQSAKELQRHTNNSTGTMNSNSSWNYDPQYVKRDYSGPAASTMHQSTVFNSQPLPYPYQAHVAMQPTNSTTSAGDDADGAKNKRVWSYTLTTAGVRQKETENLASAGAVPVGEDFGGTNEKKPTSGPSAAGATTAAGALVLQPSPRTTMVTNCNLAARSSPVVTSTSAASTIGFRAGHPPQLRPPYLASPMGESCTSSLVRHPQYNGRGPLGSLRPSPIGSAAPALHVAATSTSSRSTSKSAKTTDSAAAFPAPVAATLFPSAVVVHQPRSDPSSRGPTRQTSSGSSMRQSITKLIDKAKQVLDHDKSSSKVLANKSVEEEPEAEEELQLQYADRSLPPKRKPRNHRNRPQPYMTTFIARYEEKLRNLLLEQDAWNVLETCEELALRSDHRREFKQHQKKLQAKKMADVGGTDTNPAVPAEDEEDDEDTLDEDLFETAKRQYFVANHSLTEMSFDCSKDELTQLLNQVESQGKRLHKQLVKCLQKLKDNPQSSIHLFHDTTGPSEQNSLAPRSGPGSASVSRASSTAAGPRSESRGGKQELLQQSLQRYNDETELAQLKDKLIQARNWNSNVGKDYLRVPAAVLKEAVTELKKRNVNTSSKPTTPVFTSSSHGTTTKPKGAAAAGPTAEEQKSLKTFNRHAARGATAEDSKETCTSKAEDNFYTVGASVDEEFMIPGARKNPRKVLFRKLYSLYRFSISKLTEAEAEEEYESINYSGRTKQPGSDGVRASSSSRRRRSTTTSPGSSSKGTTRATTKNISPANTIHTFRYLQCQLQEPRRSRGGFEDATSGTATTCCQILTVGRKRIPIRPCRGTWCTFKREAIDLHDQQC